MITLPNRLLQFVADLHFSPTPCFVLYKPQFHKIKGDQVRTILNTLLPGDILVATWDGYLSNFFIPGFWCHAALYVGSNEVIHIRGEGTLKEDILSFVRTDNIAILRVKSATQEIIDKAIDKAYTKYNNNTKYDYKFVKGNANNYCSELVDECYDNLFKDDYVKVVDRDMLTPEGLYTSKKVDIILQYKG